MQSEHNRISCTYNSYKLPIMFKFYLALIVCSAMSCTNAQITAHDLLAKSIDYHDPKGLLEQGEATLQFIEERPNGPDRHTTAVLNPWAEKFQLISGSADREITTTLSDGQYSYLVNGASPTAEQVKTYRLNPSRSDFMRTYYHYLWYMPMKLDDPGTIIDPQVSKTDFFGREALQIRVTYDPAIGKDIWYFYFDPKTSALIGYRFYHDEAANDGEYILFEGEAIYQSVRIPKRRTWYTHKDDRLLGTDILDQITVK